MPQYLGKGKTRSNMNPLLVTGVQTARHAILRTLSVLCVLAVIALLSLGVKRILYPRATESYAQVVQAGGQNFNIEHHYTKPDDRLFLGLSLWGWKVGITLVGKQAIVDKIEKK
jgi:hypothetical protein